MSPTLDFAGKSVIVTGGTKGVGRGIAEAFLAAGADVIVCGRSEVDSLPSAGGRTAVFVQADVREVEAIDRVVTEAVTRFGKLDVLINFHEKILTLNLVAPLHFMQRANVAMQAQAGGGVIVNIASVSGTRPSPGTAAYGAAKAGLLSLTSSLAVEWAPKVRVTAVTAGMILTEQAANRLATPADIANACLFLASDLASYVTGTSLVVHGGGEKPAFLDASNASNEH